MSENTRDYFTGTCCSTMHTKGHMASLQRFVPATSRIRFNKLNYLQHDGGTKFAQNKIFFPPLDTCPHRIPIFRSRHGFLFGGPTVDVQKSWRPIETAQRFSMAHPKSLWFTLAATLWPVPECMQASCNNHACIGLDEAASLIYLYNYNIYHIY
jgi:hypothetical protein